MYSRFLVNSSSRWPDQGVRGMSDDLSVFEKLVSNAELSGVYKVQLTKEKPQIEPIRVSNDVKNLIDSTKPLRPPRITDIL